MTIARSQSGDDAKLLSDAIGNGATHDWDTSAPGMLPCRRCKVKAVWAAIALGFVPACSPDERCPVDFSQGWHEIAGDSLTWPWLASCMLCGAHYSLSDEGAALGNDGDEPLIDEHSDGLADRVAR